jgi:hypothetical protein
MIRILALRAFIPVWARAISLSGRLSEKTWKLLVLLQCVIFILSAGGFREARLSGPVSQGTSDVSMPQRMESELTLTSDLRRPARASRKPLRSFKKTRKKPLQRKSRRAATASVTAQRLYILRRGYIKRMNRPLVVTSFMRTPAQQALALSQIEGISTFDAAEAGPISAVSTMYLAGDVLPGLGKFVEPLRSISVQITQPDDGDYKKALLFWFSLFGLIVSSVSTVSTAVVAWISVHRSRADALLKELQMEKLRLEMDKLRVELEQARLEAEQHRLPVIIAAG